MALMNVTKKLPQEHQDQLGLARKFQGESNIA